MLRGECDYVDWAVVQQYSIAVPNLHAYFIHGAGSKLHLSQPDLVKSLILAFLNNQPMPLEPLSDRAIRKALPLVDAAR